MAREPASTEVTLAILAGGQGLRVGGADKGLQELDGRPLIAHVCAALTSMPVPQWAIGARPPDVLIIANRNCEIYSAYATTLEDAADCGSGPLAGVATALGASISPWLFTLPVDCPDPPRELLQRLLWAIGSAACAVAYDGTRRQPLFALYRHGLAESAYDAARAGLGPQAWQDRIATVEVDFQDRREHFANLNTPPDFLARQTVRDE